MLILEGDFSPKVSLGAVMAKHPTIGVGTVADARGEITIHDGQADRQLRQEEHHTRLPRPNPPHCSRPTVAGWQTLKVEQDIAPDGIEDFIAQAAGAHGINKEGPFPFQIRGTLASYVMHVNAEPTNGPHGMGQPIAVTMEIKGNSIAGMVSGIYASRDLVGIVSRGGTRTHSHWISPDGKSTAHLDSWGLKAGAELSLPKP